jgi:TolB protein
VNPDTHAGRTTGALVTLLVVSVLVLTACVGGTSISSTAPSHPVTSTSSAIPTSASPSIFAVAGQIVFEDYTIAASQHQIYIAQADGSNVRRLVTSPYDDARPSLSPDGTTVLFTRYGDGPDQAYLVNVDGTNVRPLDGCTGCGDPEGDAWSPDGRQLAVDRAFDPMLVNANGDEEATNVSIWIVNLDGTDPQEVTNNPPGSDREDHRPAWSPDGARIAFARTDYSVTPQLKAIFTIAIDGTDLRQVTPWDLDADNPEWSPDGSLIAFNSPAASLQPGREQNIFTIHPDGTGLTQLTAHLSAAPDGSQGTFDPSWSPDGTQMIFTHIPSTDGLADLFVMNRDGSDLHVLAETTDLNESHAVWGVSPVP